MIAAARFLRVLAIALRVASQAESLRSGRAARRYAQCGDSTAQFRRRKQLGNVRRQSRPPEGRINAEGSPLVAPAVVESDDGANIQNRGEPCRRIRFVS